MFFNIPQFNARSRRLINNIFLNAKSHPMYSGYEISKDEVSYADGGAIAIIVGKNNHAINMFLFYPAYDCNGKIGSVAIYGSNLSGHKRAIESSMRLFDLPVDTVEWVKGLERFLDVTLDDYNL